MPKVVTLDLMKLKVHFLQKNCPAPQDLDSKTPDAIALIPYLISQNEEARIYKAHKYFFHLLCFMGVLSDNGNPCDTGYIFIWKKKRIAIDAVIFTLYGCPVCKKAFVDISKSIPSIQSSSCTLWFYLPCVCN